MRWHHSMKTYLQVKTHFYYYCTVKRACSVLFMALHVDLHHFFLEANHLTLHHCALFHILVTSHWSTQAGLWGGSTLFLDNICQRQPRGNSSPDHSCPDRRCERASWFHWATCPEKSRYQGSVWGQRKPWGHRCRSCALCLMCFMVLWL